MTRVIDAVTGEAIVHEPRQTVCLNSLSNPSWWDAREAMQREQTSREASGIVALLWQATS